MWVQWFNINIIKRREYFWCAKKNKITTYIVMADFKTLLQEASERYESACRISGSERQSHVISAVWRFDTRSESWFDTLIHNAPKLPELHWAIGFHQKYLNLCSEDERRSYRCGTTWGWVINDRNFILGWTNPLNIIYVNYLNLNNKKAILWNKSFFLVKIVHVCESMYRWCWRWFNQLTANKSPHQLTHPAAIATPRPEAAWLPPQGVS